jgi:tRNA threonylcarbamoyladenosine biosynthesis protein TsaB
MSLILNIDTAVEIASVCLAEDREILELSINENQKDHAAWLTVTIQKMMDRSGHGLKQLKAIAVTIGPGSYTGLRVGLSAAKGLCYALDIPLITVGTFEMMAFAAKEKKADLFCPMIDARRMEVYTAVYDRTLREIKAPFSLIIDKNSFEDLLTANQVLFFGNGSDKLKEVLDHPHALFENIVFNASHMVSLAADRLMSMQFADLAYVEPFYLKEFFSPVRK